MERVFISVGSGYLYVGKFSESGYAHSGNSWCENSLKSVIRRNLHNLIIVHDNLFGTGYHRVVNFCTETDTFKLLPLMSKQEIDNIKNSFNSGILDRGAESTAFDLLHKLQDQEKIEQKSSGDDFERPMKDCDGSDYKKHWLRS